MHDGHGMLGELLVQPIPRIGVRLGLRQDDRSHLKEIEDHIRAADVIVVGMGADEIIERIDAAAVEIELQAALRIGGARIDEHIALA